MSEFRKTVCLDFDGVVHQYTRPWTRANEIRDPIMPGAIQFMLTMLAAGWRVCIHSTRCHQPYGMQSIEKWLYNQVGQAWYETPAGPGIEDVEVVAEKPPAILYIDDRGFRFEGVFPTLEYMEKFQPWKYKPEGFAG